MGGPYARSRELTAVRPFSGRDLPVFASVLLVCLIAVTVDAGAPQAVQPVERTDENSRIAHRELVEKARTGQTDLYFAGDSILRRWGALDYPELLEHFQERFHGWNAADFAWGGGRTVPGDHEVDGWICSSC